MHRTSLTRLLGGSLLFTAVAALNACGGAATDSGSGTPTAGTPATSTGATAGSSSTAGKSGTATSTGSAGKAAAGTGSTTSPVTSGTAGASAAGSSAATAGKGAAGSGTASAAAGASAAGTTGGAAGASTGAAGGSAAGGGTLGGPLKFTGMFTMGMTFPKENRCPMLGDNKSPALSWSGGPADTKSYALVLFDTGFSLLHYVLWDIPATVQELPAGLGSGYELMNPMGAHQAAAMCNNMPAYCGPCSGEGAVVPASTYELRLYALKVDKLGLTMTSTAAQAQMAVESMMLEKTVWTGKPE